VQQRRVRQLHQRRCVHRKSHGVSERSDQLQHRRTGVPGQPGQSPGGKQLRRQPGVQQRGQLRLVRGRSVVLDESHAVQVRSDCVWKRRSGVHRFDRASAGRELLGRILQRQRQLRFVQPRRGVRHQPWRAVQARRVPASQRNVRVRR
jgi:hypothetical protein